MQAQAELDKMGSGADESNLDPYAPCPEVVRVRKMLGLTQSTRMRIIKPSVTAWGRSPRSRPNASRKPYQRSVTGSRKAAPSSPHQHPSQSPHSGAHEPTRRLK